MRIRFARSARKHRVARPRILQVIDHCGFRFQQEPPSGGEAHLTVRYLYLGDDADGIALEVMAVATGVDEMLVIHAMPLRGKYRAQYQEARKWRK